MSYSQKPGYPNLSVKLFEDFDAWTENRFLELAATITTLTLRDTLYGTNEGVLQFYDNKNLHTQLNGEQIIQISVANANSENVMNRIYGCKDSAVSVDDKGDNIIAINLAPIYSLKNIKFSRAFFANATESIQAMVDGIYKDIKGLAPKLDGINAYVPRVPWVSTLDEYMQYVREVGLSVDSETHMFVWEDFKGLNLTDYKSMTSQTAKVMVVGDIKQLGSYVDHLKNDLAYDFAWLARTNQHTRTPLENVTIYSHSFHDKEIQRITVGSGENTVVVSRSGGYSEMTYRNGYEEAFRLLTMAQYDGYATCKTVGNFEYYPSQKINFGDQKNQFKSDFYIDEVVHIITNNSSETHLYLFTYGKDLVPVEIEKITNELTTMTPPSDSVQPNSTTDKGSAQWDLDILCSVALKNAQGEKAKGLCALFVRKALQAAQITQFFSGGLGNANEMGPKLSSFGWVSIGQNVTNVKKGDIAIFQRTNTDKGAKYGHICIFTGSQWVSDFIQSSVQPNRKDSLTYTVYRSRYGYTSGN